MTDGEFLALMAEACGPHYHAHLITETGLHLHGFEPVQVEGSGELWRDARGEIPHLLERRHALTVARYRRLCGEMPENPFVGSMPPSIGEVR